MKTFLLAALAALSLNTAVVPTYAASTADGDQAAATHMQQTGSYAGGGE